MTQKLKPVITDDGKERWIFYPEDNAYQAIVSKYKPDKEGIYHVPEALTAALASWWYTTAVDKARELVKGLEVPWGELQVDAMHVSETNLVIFSELLAKVSYYIVKVNDHLILLQAKAYASKEALEQAVNKRLYYDEKESEGKTPAIALRTAAVISRTKAFRNAKIELIESNTAIKSLEVVHASLERLWQTASRILSARLKEPLD